MKYGLIGEHLKHSFSKAIHEQIGDYVYEILEIEPQNVESFMKKRDFCGINVTIPYKETVIPYLDYIDDSAKKIGAVNTVVNRDGKLYGYNTDYSGMRALVMRIGLEIKNKKVLIIGTGGTSKTATAVVSDLGAKEIIYVSNISVVGALTYEEVYKSHRDVEIIFNTSPVGMYPKNEHSPIDLEKFPLLEGVLDVVYNPIRTKLVRQAKALGLKSEGGLYMLGAQAVYAYQHFTGNEISTDLCNKVFNKVLAEKENIVLVGMPSSGKTSIGTILAEKTGKTLVDTDKVIVEKAGCDIPTIFKNHGEEYFRMLEAEAINEVSRLNGIVTATGGGAILKKENVDNLKQNGTLYFLDRDLSLLLPTEDRPLSSNREAIEKRYKERYPIYCQVADVRVNGNLTVDGVAELILKEIKK
ncbi:MAG: shikimate dehydrogenase [Clostridia bacterium]|nr:shikimate dehydrogenase [Clostridia bacterium]